MKTERPANVRLATPADEDQIYWLMKEAHLEQPIFPMDEQKIRKFIRHATTRKGGVIGVIEGPRGLEAYILAVLSSYWYTESWHLEELSNFVHPNHRKTNHAKHLIQFAKWFSEQLGLPLIMGILSTKRLEGKIKLYTRQGIIPCGALFAHNTGHDHMLSENG